MRKRAKQVLRVEDTDDIVNIFFIYGNTRVSAFKKYLDRILDAVLLVDRVHIRAGGHHLGDSRILEGDDSVYHLAFVLFQSARRAALAHDMVYLFTRYQSAV